ncbi:MAG: MFS transporter [Oscillospiraceae bacterium]|nr:MFS transporter [Oscillospiraceae bacterium]
MHSLNQRFFPFLAAAAAVSLCGGLTAAVPANVVADWNLSRESITWLTLAYSLGAAAMAPVMGKLGDALGRRTAFLSGLALYTAGQFSAALCPAGQPELFIALRFFTGAGAAAIAPMIMSFIMTEFPPQKLGRGFTSYMLISCGTVIFGPALGGWILSRSSWRWVILLCGMICAAAFAIAFFFVEKSKGRENALRDFDFGGAALTLVFFSLALSVPTLGQNAGWLSPAALICAALAAAALLGLIFAEKRAKNPILNGRFMARRQFILPVAVLFLSQGLLQSCMTNLITFALVTTGDKTLSGIATSVMYVGMALGTALIGPLADKKEPRSVAAGSLVFVAAGAALQMLFTPQTPLYLTCLAMFLIGLGLGGNTTIFMKVALSGLPAELAGSGSGTYNVFRDMSMPFGVAVFVPMFSSGLTAQTAVSSLHATAAVQTACVIAAILLSLALPKIHKA